MTCRLIARTDTFKQALGTHLMDKNAEELVKLYTARADYHRRTFENVVEKGIDPPEGLLDLTQVLPEGIEKVRKGECQPCSAFALLKSCV